MTYPKILQKKQRMCARFGHLSESEGRSRRIPRLLKHSTYFCHRCGAEVARASAVVCIPFGATVSRETKREVAQ